MITKERLEKMLKKEGKVAIYLPNNTQCKVVAIPIINLIEEGKMSTEFPMDCKDLALFCSRIGLSFTPNAKN